MSDSPLRSDCRHGGSIHWGWLIEADQAGRSWEYSIANQRKAVMGANAALVLVAGLFGDAAEEDIKWTYRQITENVWRDEDLSWDTSSSGSLENQRWNTPYRAIQTAGPPKGNVSGQKSDHSIREDCGTRL